MTSLVSFYSKHFNEGHCCSFRVCFVLLLTSKSRARDNRTAYLMAMINKPKSYADKTLFLTGPDNYQVRIHSPHIFTFNVGLIEVRFNVRLKSTVG